MGSRGNHNIRAKNSRGDAIAEEKTKSRESRYIPEMSEEPELNTRPKKKQAPSKG